MPPPRPDVPEFVVDPAQSPDSSIAFDKACGPAVHTGIPDGTEFVDNFGSTALVTSWITNVVATAAISYKAWCVYMISSILSSLNVSLGVA